MMERTTTSELIIELSKTTQESKENSSEPIILESIPSQSRLSMMCAGFLRMIGYYPGCSKWHYLLLLIGSTMTGYSVFSSVDQGFNKLIDKVTPADQLTLNLDLYRILSMTASCVVSSIVTISALNEMGKDICDLENFSARRKFIGKELVKLRTDITELKNEIQAMAGIVPSETIVSVESTESKNSCTHLLIKFGFYPELTRGHYLLLIMLSVLATYEAFVSAEKGVNDFLNYLVSAGEIDNNDELFNRLDTAFASVLACFTFIFSFKNVSNGIHSLEQNAIQVGKNDNNLIQLQQDLEELKNSLKDYIPEEIGSTISSSYNFVERLFLQPDTESDIRLVSTRRDSDLSWRSYLFFIVGTTIATYETLTSADKATLSGLELINDAIDYFTSAKELNRNHELLRIMSLVIAGVVTCYIMMWTLKLVCKGLHTLKEDSAVLDHHGREVLKLQHEVEAIKLKTSPDQPFYSRISNLFRTKEAVYATGNDPLTDIALSTSRSMTLSVTTSD